MTNLTQLIQTTTTEDEALERLKQSPLNKIDLKKEEPSAPPVDN